MSIKILLVEDDAILADGLARNLMDWRFDVTLAMTVSSAEAALITHPFDLAILDLGLPDGDGRQILRQMRSRKSNIPVLILTARDGIDDRVEGLKLGADDYLTKPFESRELEARVHALLRRSLSGFGNDLVVGRLSLDTINHRIMLDGQPMLLPLREHEVLESLLIQTGRVVSKDHIAQRLASRSEELANNAIEVYIHRLRRRLAPSGINIRTVRGLGYLLEHDHNEQTT